MTADLSLFIFGISAYLVFYFLRSVPSHIKSRFIMLIACGWLIINVIKFVHFPWVHPYDQKSYPMQKLEQKMDKYDNSVAPN